MLTTIETPKNIDSTCRICKGNCNPSKAFINTHNLQLSDNKEFETKFVNCLKCENCGHSFIK
jgi:hypothetical protein